MSILWIIIFILFLFAFALVIAHLHRKSMRQQYAERAIRFRKRKEMEAMDFSFGEQSSK